MLSREELHTKVLEAQEQIAVGGQYRHYKGGEYKVLDLAFEEATMELVVVYQSQYGEHRVNFTRPLAIWSETVQWEGQHVPRFTLIEK